MFPLAGRHDSGYRVEWEDSFGALVVVVDVEGDPLAQEVEFGVGFPREEISLIEFAEFLEKGLAVASNRAIFGEHFVVKSVRMIVLKHFHGSDMIHSRHRAKFEIPPSKS